MACIAVSEPDNDLIKRGESNGGKIGKDINTGVVGTSF
jgi:hypothetical protein